MLVGHNIVAFDLEVLLARASAKENKCAMWDRIGRLRRSKMPQIRGGGAAGSNYTKFVAGRLLCDTYISARELVRQVSQEENTSHPFSLPSIDLSPPFIGLPLPFLDLPRPSLNLSAAFP